MGCETGMPVLPGRQRPSHTQTHGTASFSACLTNSLASNKMFSFKRAFPEPVDEVAIEHLQDDRKQHELRGILHLGTWSPRSPSRATPAPALRSGWAGADQLF